MSNMLTEFTGRDVFIDTLSAELRYINRHLPYERKNLCELLETEIPYIVLRDGTIHLIRREELELLKNILGDNACRLFIPIIIETAPSLGEGVFIVRDEVAVKALKRVLGLKDDVEKPFIIYRPQLYIIREKLPTTTTIFFRPV